MLRVQTELSRPLFSSSSLCWQVFMSSRKIEPNESKFGMNGRRKAVDSLKEKEDPRFVSYSIRSARLGGLTELVRDQRHKIGLIVVVTFFEV